MADEYLWTDSQEVAGELIASGSLASLPWALVAFVFVWAAEAVMVYWTIQATLTETTAQFVESACFLAGWTLICIATSLYCLKKLRSPGEDFGPTLTADLISLPADGERVAVERGNVAQITVKLNREKENPVLAQRYLLVVKTKTGNSAQAGLRDRKGLLQALSKGKWKGVNVSY